MDYLCAEDIVHRVSRNFCGNSHSFPCADHQTSAAAPYRSEEGLTRWDALESTSYLGFIPRGRSPDEGFRKQYLHRCHRMPKDVASEKLHGLLCALAGVAGYRE
jgi:hypothetical protein